MKDDPSQIPTNMVGSSGSQTNADAYRTLLHAVATNVLPDNAFELAEQLWKARANGVIVLKVGPREIDSIKESDLKAVFREIGKLDGGKEIARSLLHKKASPGPTITLPQFPKRKHAGS